MRRLLLAFALLTLPATGRAGLYIPGEPPDLPFRDGKVEALPFDLFRIKLHDVMGIGVPSKTPTPLREEYQKKRDELLGRGVKSLPITELVALSGYEIRLGEPSKAIEVLQEARTRDRRNFLVESQWALLAHMTGEPNAVNYQLDVLQMRPKELPGFSAEQLAWDLKAERALLNVWKARAKEQREKGPRAQPETPDALFPLQFVGPNGKYEAGTVAEAEKAKIPDDAIATVQQLLFWLPYDSRLYWLLAELYNATGDVTAAAVIMDECVDARRFQVEQLREHRRAVKDELLRRQETATAARVAEQERQKQSDWRNHPEVFWVIGGVIAVPLLLLGYWQLRLMLKRLHGDCPTGH
jgi:hypothetical protein